MWHLGVVDLGACEKSSTRSSGLACLFWVMCVGHCCMSEVLAVNDLQDHLSVQTSSIRVHVLTVCELLFSFRH